MEDEQQTTDEMLAPLSFELRRREVPVTLTDPDTGQEQGYVLVELDGAGRDAYLTNLGGRVKTNQDGKMAGLKTFEGLQANLLCRCMFKVTPEGRKPVDIKTVQAWPARVQTALFQRCKAISALGEDSKEKEGND